MTYQEKYIYNCYLETSRKLNNKPFRYRQDFEGFEDKEEYGYIVKLAYMFNKFSTINVKDFFEAPYFVYNEKYFDLKFFTTQRAKKSYTIYETTFLPNNPDHEQSLIKIKSSFMFIFKFCKEQGISIEKYCTYIKPGDKIHSFLLHMKSRDISIYSLFILPNFDKSVAQYDTEIKSLLFGDTLLNLNFYRTKYYSSTKAKKLCVSAFSLLTSDKK